MNFRLAQLEDLSQLELMYKKMIEDMNHRGINIWDEVYPCMFFEEDIQKQRLYVLENEKDILAAFALTTTNQGEMYVQWQNEAKHVLYLDRFGVNVNYQRQGIASIMLEKAKEIAKKKNTDCLRLFVVDINQPAINLYIKNGFVKANGIYHQQIDEDFILNEYGYEYEIKGE